VLLASATNVNNTNNNDDDKKKSEEDSDDDEPWDVTCTQIIQYNTQRQITHGGK